MKTLIVPIVECEEKINQGDLYGKTIQKLILISEKRDTHTYYHFPLINVNAYLDISKTIVNIKLYHIKKIISYRKGIWIQNDEAISIVYVLAEINPETTSIIDERTSIKLLNSNNINELLDNPCAEIDMMTFPILDLFAKEIILK